MCKMETPTTGGELQQFVCVMQCMRSGILECSNFIHPLAEALKIAYAHNRIRTRFAAGWVIP